MHDTHVTNSTPYLPGWVPRAAAHYLAHTERGQSIRALARENDCHPSTILRQVRRFEQRRDDPLVDDALRALSKVTNMMGEIGMETKAIDVRGRIGRAKPQEGLTQARIDQEAKRVLLRLCEPGAVMAVAREMETAVIVRETPLGDQLRTAVVDREIAQAMALKEWITCPDATGRIARYFVTNAGRAALRRLTAQDENAASGFADTRAVMGPEDAWDINEIEGEAGRSSRYQAFESPLIGLSRRRDRDGQPFLSRDLVVAGERLREDFELAKMGSQVSADAATFMASVPLSGSPKGANAGHERAQAALRDLGPGLSDVTFHCCCLLEGLENTEKSMGWSARSGKIVLRIALHRLKRHYDELGNCGQMIG